MKKKRTSRRSKPSRAKSQAPRRKRSGSDRSQASAVLSALKESGRPMQLGPLAAALGVRRGPPTDKLRRVLDEMIRGGQVLRNRRGAFLLMDRTSLIRGTVQGHPDGFGFVVPDEAGDDVHLAPREMKRLFHCDRVAVRITRRDGRGRVSGEVAEVLERGVTELVGRFRMDNDVSFLVPSYPRQSRDVVIPRRARSGARDGQIVVAEIVQEPASSARAVARVTEVLGEATDPQMEIEIAVRAFGIPHKWPADVLAEARSLGNRVKPRDKRDREDFRDLPLVTIDGDDARDFDDAIYAARKRGGWRLVVAIADVAHYVKSDAPLDREGYERATSVYFPRRVVPMLPEGLSNELCSLKPRVDRLALVCDMSLNNAGKVTRSRFVKGLIRSQARLTYEGVQALLDGDASERARHSALVPHLETLHELYRKLAVARRRRGALEFDRPEPHFRFDDDDSVAGVEPYPRTDTHRIIEECMIAANVEAARFLQSKKVPALYRVHDDPNPEKVKELRAAAKRFGLELGGDDTPRPRDFAKLLKQVAGRPEAEVLTLLALRSLARAEYHAECNGHFGLGLESYAHFTSPIRRYPDLLVHRAITHVLAGGKVRDYGYSQESMAAMGRHCSINERRADEASWDVQAWLKCSFMNERVGQSFDGRIVGVADFGLFVQIDDALVDGLVHVAQLDEDYYAFDARTHTLAGSTSGRRFRLGDRVRVLCAGVRIDERKIDFSLIEHKGRALLATRHKARSSNRTKKKAQPSKSGRATKGGKSASKRGKRRK